MTGSASAFRSGVIVDGTLAVTAVFWMPVRAENMPFKSATIIFSWQTSFTAVKRKSPFCRMALYT